MYKVRSPKFQFTAYKQVVLTWTGETSVEILICSDIVIGASRTWELIRSGGILRAVSTSWTGCVCVCGSISQTIISSRAGFT